MRQSRIFVGMVLILIFAEVLGLYGYVHRSDATSQQLTYSDSLSPSFSTPEQVAELQITQDLSLLNVYTQLPRCRRTWRWAFVRLHGVDIVDDHAILGVTVFGVWAYLVQSNSMLYPRVAIRIEMR